MVFKRVRFLLLCFLLSPFLVCDPQPTATHYEVSLDGGGWVSTPAPLHYDLEGISIGWHTIQAKACNSAGCSDPAELRFQKKLPTIPQTPYIGD